MNGAVANSGAALGARGWGMLVMIAGMIFGGLAVL